MNTISMKVLIEALDAINVARKAILLTDAPLDVYKQLLNAGSALSVAIKDMEAVEVTK